MKNASNVNFKFKFDVNVRYRLIAVQLQRVKIDSLGKIRSYLDG